MDNEGAALIKKTKNHGKCIYTVDVRIPCSNGISNRVSPYCETVGVNGGVQEC